jgi:hypothetical protein
MEILLVVVALTSLLVALVTSTVAWRVIREERQRSAARVEAIAAEASLEEADHANDMARSQTYTPPPAAAVRTVDRPEKKVESRPPSPIRPTAAADATGNLFGAVELPPARGPLRPLALAGVAAIFAIVIAIAFFSQGNAEERAAPAPAAATQEAGELDLLTLTHTGRDSTWTIAGMVRNGSVTEALGGVTAIAFVFDEAGSFLGSGRASLELNPLGPGESSPFRVTVAAAGPVARYRIGFRSDDGHVIRHFDRRPLAPEQARP